jgi:hypothetical protein
VPQQGNGGLGAAFFAAFDLAGRDVRAPGACLLHVSQALIQTASEQPPREAMGV